MHDSIIAFIRSENFRNRFQARYDYQDGRCHTDFATLGVGEAGPRILQLRSNRACHADVSGDLRMAGLTERTYVWTRHQDPNPGPLTPGATRYLDWLLNRSPWAGFFVLKDAEEALNTGTLIYSEDKSANFLLQALQFARFLNTEQYNIMGRTITRYLADPEFRDLDPAALTMFVDNLGISDLWNDRSEGVHVTRNVSWTRLSRRTNSGSLALAHLPWRALSGPGYPSPEALRARVPDQAQNSFRNRGDWRGGSATFASQLGVLSALRHRTA